MNRIQNFRVTFSTTMGITLISLSFILKELIAEGLNIDESLIVISTGILSLIFSLISATLFTELCLKNRTVRRIIYGKNFIEGFWLFESVVEARPGKVSLTTTRLTTPGLGEIFYDTGKKSFAVTFYRYHPNDTIEESFTHSNAIIFDDVGLNYVNHFAFGGVEGSAFGKFFSSPGERLPNRYQGTLLTTDGSLAIKQFGRKLDAKELHKLRSQHKENWRKYLVQQSDNHLEKAA